MTHYAAADGISGCSTRQRREVSLLKSTLSEILEVEKTARFRIAQAEDYQKSILDSAQEEAARILAERMELAKKKVETRRVEMEKRAEEEIQRVERQAAQDLAQLEEISRSGSDAWVQTLYERTLSDA